MPVIFNLVQLMCHVGNVVDGESDENALNIHKRSLQRKRFWRGAEEILAAKYLQKVGIVKSDTSCISVRGICVQVSHPGPQHNPLVIDFTFTRNDDENEITCGVCTCTAGVLGKCKHAMALLLYLTSKSESDLEVWSSTDDRCYWKNSVTAFQKEIAEPIPAKKFCHPKPPRTTEESFDVVHIPADEFESSEEYRLILSGFSERSAYVKHIVGRGTEVEEQAEVEELSPLAKLFLQQAYSDEIFKVQVDVDATVEHLCSLGEKYVDFFVKNVYVTEEDRSYIFKETTQQSSSLFWRKCRQVRITGCVARQMFTYASNIAPDWKQKCKNVFFSTFKGNEHTRFGSAKEKVAMRMMAEEFGRNSVLQDVGLLICLKYPWLGFSGDAFLLQNNEFILIECKSLEVGRTAVGLHFLRQATCLTEQPRGSGIFQLKKRNSFYTQIQLGLYVCNLRRAKLLLYNHKGERNYYIDVERDNEHIKELVISLTRTYFKYCIQYSCDNESELFQVS